MKPIQLKVNVTVEQYIALKHIAEQYGVSMSQIGQKGIQEQIVRFHDSNMDSDDMFNNPLGPNEAR
jgi:hypothetical protein